MAADTRLRPNGRLHSYGENPLAVFRYTAFAEHNIFDKSSMRIGLRDILGSVSQNVHFLISVLL